MSDRVLWGRYLVKGAYYFRESYGYTRMGNVFRSGQDNSLVLVRQPDNRYDGNAIQVHTAATDTQVGWVAKELNRELALIMDNFDVDVIGLLRKESDFVNHKLYMDVYVCKKAGKELALMAENAKLMAKLKSVQDKGTKLPEGIRIESINGIMTVNGNLLVDGTIKAGQGLTTDDSTVTKTPVTSDFL